ncbi:hypothetical protein V1508DRAFT_399943 [Lipomyces doorenjongii]|uniref:uncharacterized protein n=1 Tax=Lipomyces doorenjongii TaxID=383834 RepID=UPI0034CDA0E5
MVDDQDLNFIDKLVSSEFGTNDIDSNRLSAQKDIEQPSVYRWLRFLVRHSQTDFDDHIALAQNTCAANIFAAVFVRNEHILNLQFLLCAGVRSAPLWLRDHFARDFHYGGLRSGAGVSGVVWFAIYRALAVKDAALHSSTNTPRVIAILVVKSTCLIVFIIIPIGWTAVVLFWALLFVSTASTAQAQGRPYAVCLYKSAVFWFLLLITLLIVYPWTRLRKRHVRPEILSSHAIRLHFDYAPIALCQGIRISTRPLLEWHSFATIPETSVDKDFSLSFQSSRRHWFGHLTVPVTIESIRNPLSHTVVTRDPIITYGQAIVDEVYRVDPDAVVINARRGVRPDMVLETYELVKQSNAEDVFVVANPSATREVVYGIR